MATRRPRNRCTAIHAPSGKPMAQAMSAAARLTSSDRETMRRSSRSAPAIRRTASAKLARMSDMPRFSQAARENQI
jgi:hypothetical protein